MLAVCAFSTERAKCKKRMWMKPSLKIRTRLMHTATRAWAECIHTYMIHTWGEYMHKYICTHWQVQFSLDFIGWQSFWQDIYIAFQTRESASTPHYRILSHEYWTCLIFTVHNWDGPNWTGSRLEEESLDYRRPTPQDNLGRSLFNIPWISGDTLIVSWVST